MDDSLTGVIKKLVPDKGFGFIAGDDGIDRFFHRSDLCGAYFPSDRCVCGCAALSHLAPDGPRLPRGHCLTCNACDRYRPAGSPHAICEGQRVHFLHRDEDKGPRARQVTPEAHG